MRYSRGPHSAVAIVLAAFGVIVAIAVVGVVGVEDAYAFHASGEPVTLGGEVFANGDEHDPESNLPFLFAVFFITWAAFFAYVFIMSRRQGEMRGEIEALRRVLTEQEERAAKAESEGESGES